nr:unnamed protein product [Digitaria exilis]
MADALWWSGVRLVAAGTRPSALSQAARRESAFLSRSGVRYAERYPSAPPPVRYIQSPRRRALSTTWRGAGPHTCALPTTRPEEATTAEEERRTEMANAVDLVLAIRNAAASEREEELTRLTGLEAGPTRATVPWHPCKQHRVAAVEEERQSSSPSRLPPRER